MRLEELISQFQKKDKKAFGKLYEMYAVNICGVINTIVRNEARAEEICHDVFIKVWDNADRYDPSKGRFFTWILNIARNAAIDELRSKSHKREKLNLSTDFFVGILERPEEDDKRDFDSTRLKKMLGKLKKKCIELIEMLYFRGYTQQDASEVLQIPVGTVKTRNRNCISQLRKNMSAS
ncbi:RNA polymerase sigma factor [Muriicola marianensis]|uniref:RNA polymerase sigma factor SigK n=1 Tax=Muriicola marianensis TaxID=1324801 RepID=A0ABQ1QUI9_9FLAO|nr:sigma-70 family RNA polymerase sigma factor [Muriicola marianensis]GGD47003.1 RNA polymerase sigma factor SigK [Muriicola marianensis]